MNTDKIYAEQIANEYAPKDTSKVKALKRLDAKVKLESPNTLQRFEGKAKRIKDLRGK
jgi:phenylacetate-coenzyme A ligase PaaK-like adenylate-forming protein